MEQEEHVSPVKPVAHWEQTNPLAHELQLMLMAVAHGEQMPERLKYPVMQVVQLVAEENPVSHTEQSIPVNPTAQVIQTELLLHTLQ
jgi:hypothetical protein